MKAKEANLIAKAKEISVFYEALDKIMCDIKHNSAHGYFEFNCWIKIPENVKEHLIKLGYFLESKKDGNTLISWHKKIN